MIWRRIKNLWEISAYKLRDVPANVYRDPMLIKDFPTVKKKLATIIQDDPIDLFNEKNTG